LCPYSANTITKKQWGGEKNKELSDETNSLLQVTDELLNKAGLFDDDPDSINKIGTGEAYIRVNYVHVSGPLGESLERVATAKLEKEAADSEAEILNRRLNRPSEIGLNEWVMGEVARAGKGTPEKPAIPATATTPEIPTTPAVPPTPAEIANVVAKLKKGGKNSEYAKKERSLQELRSRELSGGGTYDVDQKDININITSGDEPLKDTNIAGIIGTIGGVVAAIAAAKEGGENPGNKRKKRKPGEFLSDEEY